MTWVVIIAAAVLALILQNSFAVALGRSLKHRGNEQWHTETLD